MDFAISIPHIEAINGTHKNISYQVDGTTAQLIVRIPPNFPSGGKLRIRNKGHTKNYKRGDLLISINIWVSVPLLLILKELKREVIDIRYLNV